MIRRQCVSYDLNIIDGYKYFYIKILLFPKWDSEDIYQNKIKYIIIVFDPL